MPDTIKSTSTNPLVHENPRINVQYEDELTEWADEFGVTPEEIRKAVAIVGDRPEKVAEYISSHPDGIPDTL